MQPLQQVVRLFIALQVVAFHRLECLGHLPSSMSLDALKVVVHVSYIHIDPGFDEFHQHRTVFGSTQDHNWS
eukprot:Skav230658  [mRNA]  locus=scaffold2185:9433:9952:- [translate_table: standard]